MHVIFFLISLTLFASLNALVLNSTSTECDTNQLLPKDARYWVCQTGCNCVYTQTNEDGQCGSIDVKAGATATIDCSAKGACQPGCAISTDHGGAATIKCTGAGSCYAVGVGAISYGYGGTIDMQCSGENSCEAVGATDDVYLHCTGQNSCRDLGCRAPAHADCTGSGSCYGANC